MKRNLARGGIAILACLLMGITACSSAKPSGSSKAPTTLHAVMSDEASDLSPFTATQQGKTQILSVIGTPMLYVNGDGAAATKILSSWKQSADLKTVTLVLKPNMKWSDGKPMTSADLKFSLAAYLDSKISSNAGRIGAVVGEDAVTAGTAQLPSGIATPDANTVTIQLVTPDASWLPKLSLLGSYWPVLPSHLLGSVSLAQLPNNSYFKTWPVTSGSYLLSKFVQGQYAQVKENPKSTVGMAHFPNVVFQVLTTDQMTAKLQTGELDYIYTVDPTDAARVKAIPGVTLASHQGVAPDVFDINYNLPALKNPLVRQAMIYGINRAGICKTILAGNCTTPLTNLRQIGPSWAIPTSGITSYNYDPAKAKQLLAEAHWNPNTKLVFYARTQRSYVDKAVTVAIGQLAQIGMHFTIRNISVAQLLTLIKSKTGWAAFWNSGADFVTDPDEWADYVLCSQRYPNGGNTDQYCDPTTDKLLAQGLTATTQAARGKIYQQAFTRLNQNPPDVDLYIANAIVAYNSHLQNVQVSGNLSGGYWNIADWTWKS